MPWLLLAALSAVAAVVVLFLAIREPGGAPMAVYAVWSAVSLVDAVFLDGAVVRSLWALSAICVITATYIEWHAKETARMNPEAPEGQS